MENILYPIIAWDVCHAPPWISAWYHLADVFRGAKFSPKKTFAGLRKRLFTKRQVRETTKGLVVAKVCSDIASYGN